MDNVKIDYHNAEIQQLLNKYVTEEKYGKYKYFLDEIIHRRAFEFDFSLERIENEIQSMVNNIEAICFDSEDDEINLEENTVAAYSPKNKKIYINEKLFDEYYKYYKNIYAPGTANYLIGEKLFSALNHEVYHAITRIDEKIVGIEHLDSWGMNSTTCTYLNEVITESASTRTVRTKKQSNFKNGYRETLGYQNTTCMTSLLAHAIGVSEKELLSHGLSNYAEFKNFFSKHAPEGSGDASIENDIRTIDSNATIANTYIRNEKPENNADVFLRMYKTMLDLAGRHIGADKRKPTMETVGEMFCRALKMNTIIISSLNYLEREGIITPEGKKQVQDDEELVKLVESNRKRILGKFLIYKENLKPGTIEYNYAKWGTPLEVFENFEDGEISSESMRKYRDLTYDEVEKMLRAEAQTHPKFFCYSMNVIRDDFQSDVSWENSIFHYGARILREHKEKQEQEKITSRKKDRLFSVNESTIPVVSMNASLIGQNTNKRIHSLEENDDDAR